MLYQMFQILYHVWIICTYCPGCLHRHTTLNSEHFTLDRWHFWVSLIDEILDLFRLCPPVRSAPPVTEHVPLNSKSLCKKWNVRRLRGANNMRSLSWGGGAQTEKIRNTYYLLCNCSILPLHRSFWKKWLHDEIVFGKINPWFEILWRQRPPPQKKMCSVVFKSKCVF